MIPADNQEYKYRRGVLQMGSGLALNSLNMSPTVAIVSIGEMGLGMARLLKAHDYRVVTVAEGRR
jgi:hypothetical protein